jgi:predicted metal-binding transcription factor (methanogenesis marker protein 9)
MQLVDFDQLLKKLRGNLKRTRKPEKCEQLTDFIQKLEMLKEIDQKEMLTEEDINKAMSVTCYENIGYCCGLAKRCLWRDSCRQALGIDDETYVEVKEQVVWEILNRLRKREESEIG